MKVTQAVFGVFHHFELAHQMQRLGHLRKVYSTWPWARLKREGLPRHFVECFPWIHTTDYLLARTKFYPRAVSAWMNRWAALTFDDWTYAAIEPCDAFIAIAGAGLRTGRKVQEWGGKFVCDRGSTHQRYQEQVLAAEYKRWGITMEVCSPHIVVREEAIYSQADAITVPSSVAKRSFVAMGTPAQKVHVLPYGVRLDYFRPVGAPREGGFDVLFAGQVGLRKGIPYLLEAFARVKHPRKTLTVVGHMQDDMRTLLPGLAKQGVTFTGSVRQTELARRMSESHLFVLPSIEEGLALVQGQAMACGCPVLATVATGAEDLFTDGVEGFIVGDRDVDALVQRMQQVADDPWLRERLGKASLERVKVLGGWDSYGNAWDDLLHRLTGASRDEGERL